MTVLSVQRDLAILFLLTLCAARVCYGAKFTLVFKDKESGLQIVEDEDDDDVPIKVTPKVMKARREVPGEDMDELVEKYKQGDLDPGSWRSAIEAPLEQTRQAVRAGDPASFYAMGIKRLLGAPGVSRNIPQAIDLLQIAADSGFAHAQSALGFLHASGYGVPVDGVKAFLLHSFAAKGGSFHSKMALANAYLRQKDYALAADLYADVAAKSIAANSLPGMAPFVETVSLSSDGEENEEAMKGHQGEADERIQFIEYSASKGSPDALLTLGNLFYWGARGMPRDYVRAFHYFKRASDLGDPRAMVTLGEMLTHGVGVMADPERALGLFQRAAKKGLVSAHNGIGYLYAKGLGVNNNFTKAVEHFAVAAHLRDPDGLYNLGMCHLRGQGVKHNADKALQLLTLAKDSRHLGAAYQVAKMHHYGRGAPKNDVHAAMLYKAVSESGPWGSLLRWAHDCYMGKPQTLSPSPWTTTSTSSSSSSSLSVPHSSPKSSASFRFPPHPALARCDVGTSLLLYSRVAELGYEVAQSNAAWLLDKASSSSGMDTACVGPPRVVGAHSKPSPSPSSSSPSPTPSSSSPSDPSDEEAPSAVSNEGTTTTTASTTATASASVSAGEVNELSEQQAAQPQPHTGTVPGERAVVTEAQVSIKSSHPPSPAATTLEAPSPAAPVGGFRRWRRCTETERQQRSHRLWSLAAEQGNVQAALLVGDAFFYGRGQSPDLERAADAYRRAREKRSAQAMFNLGFMHEHGLGLPRDLHLAKRYYDEALETQPRAIVPVWIALSALWLRRNAADTPLIPLLDALPSAVPAMTEAINSLLLLDGTDASTNSLLLTLLASFAALVFLRWQLRRQQHQQEVQRVRAAAFAAAVNQQGDGRAGEGLIAPQPPPQPQGPPAPPPPPPPPPPPQMF